MIPTQRLWVVLCALSLPAVAAGFLPDLWTAIAGVDVLLLALALLDFSVARAAVLTARRELPHRMSVGAPNRIHVHLHNRGGRELHLLIRDDLPDQLEAVPDPLELTLDGHSRAVASYRVTPHQRGRFDLGDLTVRVLGPLGLMWHERLVPAPARVSIYPDLRGASRLLLSGAALDLVNLGLRELRRDGRGTEFARLRDYTQGDSVREVAWKATARRGRPVTRVMESERSQSVLICVDAGRGMAARVDGLSRLDHAVNAALFLAFVAVRNGDRVGLAVFSDEVKAYLAPDAGRKQYRKIVDTLYGARPELTYVDYHALFRQLSVRLLRRTLLCVFTDFMDEEQARAVLPPLRRLARRHVALCLSVKDTALHKLLREPPPGPEEAYQLAAASEAMLEREQIRHAISRDGVRLFDVAPEQLSLTAVNRYLDIKARGAL
ncbi:MAG TPA: DUF58 domain-containing protein [Myxococcales bacterium]|nr:DUF58 domain-containing protein [Myxococcales bacterium]